MCHVRIKLDKGDVESQVRIMRLRYLLQDRTGNHEAPSVQKKLRIDSRSNNINR